MIISVVYITNGKKNHILEKCIESAKFADEIIVVGNVNFTNDEVIKLEELYLANMGMISKMRNIGADAATGDIIINADDDIFFPPKFKKRLFRFIKRNPNIKSLNTKVIGLNGSRYWDRAIHDRYGNSYMIDYKDSNEDLYYSGALIIRTKDFAQKYKWDDSLNYYQKEDVEYSNRIKEKGYSINVDSNNYVIHLDTEYTSRFNDDGQLTCSKSIEDLNIVDDPQYHEYREISAILIKLGQKK